MKKAIKSGVLAGIFLASSLFIAPAQAETCYLIPFPPLNIPFLICFPNP